ncbi:MAG: class 3 adenylate cyclase [Candidatus Poriferisodalaceae bacterium]|jgi:class 3 adenylate cyclase
MFVRHIFVRPSGVAENRITVRTPNRRPLTVLVDAPLVLGRDCDGLILADQRVSRRHTSFEPTADGLTVTDLQSSNGTSVNGAPVTGPTSVSTGDIVAIGNTMITVHSNLAGDDSGGQQTMTEIVPLPDPAMLTSIELVAEAVEQHGSSTIAAEIVGAEEEPGTLTVVFTDIESSTELALSMGDTAWFDVLGRHHQLVTAHVDAHHGRIVKNQGDGYMLCFRSARGALLACIGMQRDLERLHTEMIGLDGRAEAAAGAEGEPIDGFRVRMGAHTGEVMMQDDGDLFGKHVIVAARVGGLATGGQILVSSLVKLIAEPRGDIPFGPPDEAQLKGLGGFTVVHDVDWRSYQSI